MHAGSIENPQGAAGRVYEYLKGRLGDWVDGWELGQECKSNAVSTRVSEVRHQAFRLGMVVESEQRGRKWFYRLRLIEGQAEFRWDE